MKYFYLFSCALMSMMSTQLSAQTTYLWSTGATTPTISVNPTVTTTYYVTITHNGVQYLDSLTVQVNPLPTITGQNSICSGGTTQLTGSGTPAVLDPWVSSNTNVATISSSGLLTALSIGSTTITYTNSLGCTKTLVVQVTQGSTGIDVINSCGPIIWIDGNTYAQSNNTATFNILGGAANGCDSLVTLNLTVTTPPVQPNVACWQTATFNSSTCQWDVTGTQPNQPTIACYETATFNTTTCQWEVTGTQPNQPTLACYQTATFNPTTCQWDVNGTQPNQPTLACYQTATFNTATCQWDVTGTQPTQPVVSCFQTAIFNGNTCQWDVIGSQPAGNDVIGSCGPIIWIDGNTYSTSNYTATHLLIGASQFGCDSLVTLKFTRTPCTQLQTGDCNVTQLPTNVVIRATAVSGALVYRFRVSGPNNGSTGWINNTFILNRTTRTMRFELIPGTVLGATYNVDVAVSLDGVNFGGFGSICTVGLQGNLPTTNIMASSCGITNANPSTEIQAVPSGAATSYRFRFSGINTGGLGWNNNEFIIDRPTHSCPLNLIPGLVWNQTYTVDVAVLIQGNSSYGAYGNACSFTYYSLTTQMEASSCNVSNVTLSASLFATSISGATGYRFRITGNNTGAIGWNGGVYILDRPTRDFKLNMIPGIIWNESYNVEVAILNQTGSLYGPYGNACNVSTHFPTTQLDALSCNASGVLLATTLRAVSNTLATGYRFRITGNNTGASGWNGNVFILNSTSRSFKFSSIPGVIAGQTYQVQVALLRQDGLAYGPFGQPCNVTLNSVLMPGIMNEVNSDVSIFEVKASHNPYSTDFGLQITSDSDDEMVLVGIYDLSGKRIEDHVLHPLDIESIRFGTNLMAGMYIVEVRQGSRRQLLRQVKN